MFCCPIRDKMQMMRYGLCSLASVLVTSLILTTDTSSILRESQISFLTHNIEESTHFIDSPDSGLIDWKSSKVKSTRKLPNALIIGARKAGTTTLLEFLTMNYQIKVCHLELGFFHKESEYKQGLEHYRSMMPYTYPGQITIEKTPEYFTYPEAPVRIFQMNSDIKLILILRNPVERLLSDYAHNYWMGKKHGDRVETQKSLESLVFNSTGHVDQNYKPVSRGIYYELLKKWFAYFPRKQFLILDGEKLVENPVPVLNEVEQFLGIKSEIRDHHFVYDKAKGFYCKNYGSQVSCMGKNKGLQHPKISPSARKKIAKFYHPHNEKLFKLIGRRFSWT